MINLTWLEAVFSPVPLDLFTETEVEFITFFIDKMDDLPGPNGEVMYHFYGELNIYGVFIHEDLAKDFISEEDKVVGDEYNLDITHLQRVIQNALKRYPTFKAVTIEAAQIGNNYLESGRGGWACHITKDKVKEIDTREWLGEQSSS